MKSTIKLALAGIVTALVATGSAFGDSQWRTGNYGNATVGYVYTPQQNHPALALYAHGMGVGQRQVQTKNQKLRFESQTFGNARVGYNVPGK